MVSYLCSWHVCMVVSQVDDNWGTLDGILWFVMVTYVHDSWWHYIGIICAWPLIKYIYIYKYICVYIYMFMILDGHWQCVCVCACVWCIIMILVVWITACFFVLTCPHPFRFQFKHDNCVYVCVFGSVIMILVVWITACFFVLTCPHLSRFFNFSMKTYP